MIHPQALVALGRKRPIARGPRLCFASYMMKAMPECPVEDVDYSIKSEAFLKQVLLNDKLGCCTASGAFHIGGSLLANAGYDVPYTDNNVRSFYSATSGYVDGNESTDQGASEVDVLNYWADKGLLGDGTHRIVGRLSIDGTNQAEVMSAIYAFENLYFGIELSDDWLASPPYSGQVWNASAVPNPNNGHCVVAVKAGKQAGGVVVDSWGYEILMPFDTVAKYTATPLAGELYSVLSPDGIVKAQHKFPSGLDWSQLVADLVSTSN